jgi:hypothetical protein
MGSYTNRTRPSGPESHRRPRSAQTGLGAQSTPGLPVPNVLSILEPASLAVVVVHPRIPAKPQVSITPGAALNYVQYILR